MKRKVMLSIAPWDMWGEEEDRLYPLGLAYLGAVLEKSNYETSILNLTNTRWEEVEEKVKERILKENPDFFGISILSNSRVSALKLLKLARKIKPKMKIIAGGVHTTFMYKQILENYPVDYAVLGEGEATLIELLDAIKKNKELRKIKGIAFRDKGEIIKTEPRERIKNLDKLPIPKHDFFSDIINRHSTAYMMTSRGCPFGCAFCPSSAYWGRCRVQRSAENIFAEIKYLLKKFPKLKIISFSDDEFICDNERVLKLCKMMIDEKIKIEWHCLARASSVNDNLLKWMKKAGCRFINFGIESGSQRILDNIGKNVKIKQIIEAIDLCRKNNIKISCMFITGLPGENKESVRETINLVKRIRYPAEPAILLVFPGTRVYELAKQKGLMTDEYWLGEGLVPLYTCEHSKFQLWWWSFKTGLVGHWYSEEGDVLDFLNRKIFSKFKPHNFLRILKRYVSGKT